MKSIKKKLSIIALAASLLGCKSAMAVSPFASPSISAGQQYFNGKKKSGRNGSKEKSQKRDKVDISLPIPTLGDLKVWVPGLYLVANEIAGDLGLSNREFFGKHTIHKDVIPFAHDTIESAREYIDNLKYGKEIADYIRNRRNLDKERNIVRAKYYYQNLGTLLLCYGVNNEESNKLIQIMDMQENSNFNFLYSFWDGYTTFANDVTEGINKSRFKNFFDKLRGEKELGIIKGDSSDFFEFDNDDIEGMFYALSFEEKFNMFGLNIQEHRPSKIFGATDFVEAKFVWNN